MKGPSILAIVAIPAIIPNIEPKESRPKYSLNIAPLKVEAPHDKGKRIKKGIISHVP